MIYKIDNRPNRNKNKYITLGIVLGIALTIGGFYIYDNYKSAIIQNVNLIKDTAISEIPKVSKPQSIPTTTQDNAQQNNQTFARSWQAQPSNSNNNPPQTSDNVPPQNNQPVTQVPDNTPSPTTTNIDVTTLEHQIHDQINVQRTQNNLTPLAYDEAVATMARNHSKDMATNNYFDHTSPTGETMENRLYNARIPCMPAGENIEQNYASTPNLLDSIIQTWMSSTGHRENILYPTFMREGIGVALSGDSVYITEDFC